MTSHRICCLGSPAVGKSALVIQLVSHHFVEEYDPTIEDFYRKRVVLDGDPSLLEIYDTAGQVEFQSVSREWIQSCHSFLLIYSIVSQQSFKEVKQFAEQARAGRDLASISLMVVGNKCDLEDLRQVTFGEGQEMACHLGAQFLETSAKSRLNVEEAFYGAVRGYTKMHPPPVRQPRKKTCSLL